MTNNTLIKIPLFVSQPSSCHHINGFTFILRVNVGGRAGNAWKPYNNAVLSVLDIKFISFLPCFFSFQVLFIAFLSFFLSSFIYFSFFLSFFLSLLLSLSLILRSSKRWATDGNNKLNVHMIYVSVIQFKENAAMSCVTQCTALACVLTALNTWL
jgi:hypothetical protein